MSALPAGHVIATLILDDNHATLWTVLPISLALPLLEEIVLCLTTSEAWMGRLSTRHTDPVAALAVDKVSAWNALDIMCAAGPGAPPLVGVHVDLDVELVSGIPLKELMVTGPADIILLELGLAGLVKTGDPDDTALSDVRAEVVRDTCLAVRVAALESEEVIHALVLLVADFTDELLWLVRRSQWSLFLHDAHSVYNLVKLLVEESVEVLLRLDGN